MSPDSAPWVLVGCGRMGSALLKGWARPDAIVIEPNNPAYLPDIEAAGNISPALVVFAVKPQAIAGVVPAYAKFRGATFLSIAAGKTIAGFEALLGPEAAIVRAMPNTPAAIGKGVSVAVANGNVSAAGRTLANDALKAGGMVEWVGNESLLDAVTALSGSGPAYVFYLVEVMARAGEAMGLAPDLAMKLARQTVIGSGHLLEQSADGAAALREAVTSPGGTTAAALHILKDSGRLQDLMTEALEAAQARGRELAG